MDILVKIPYGDKLSSQTISHKQSNPNFYLHKKFRNSVVKDVRASKIQLFKKRKSLLCSKNNMKKNMVWNYCRSIINIHKVKGDYIPSILENG